MMASWSLRCALPLALLLVSPAFGEGVVVYDRAGLSAALARGTYCCVVDARSEPNRKKDPLGEAVPYREGLRITPTAAVVVIADSDAEGLRIGKILARENKAKDVFVIKGGTGTWRAATAAAEGAPPPSVNFVIPRNTCEQGKPLQELKSDRP